MTKKELLQKLQNLPDDAEIYVLGQGGAEGTPVPLESVSDCEVHDHNYHNAFWTTYIARSDVDRSDPKNKNFRKITILS